ncbi:hypothetical protein FACS1894164_19410 [Spirochaetia bacterium]|nr:hypothetical protein FACS1894164_19410 [Spirochaetia bacterium]
MEGINKTLDEAIRAKDIEEVRNVLTTSMVQDPGFSKGVFEERFKRCLIGLSETNIFDPFDGEPLNLNQSAWTKDYYAAQQTEFRYNFSLERLEHLKKVGRKLFPSAAPRPFLPDDEVKFFGCNGVRLESRFLMGQHLQTAPKI